MGLGGSTFTPFGTPSEFPESRFADWLEHMWRAADSEWEALEELEQDSAA